MSRARLIGKSISFIIVSRIVFMLVSFMLFPFVVSSVGKEIYGVYLIVISVTGYFGLLDFGVMSALLKYVSEYHGKGDFRGISRIISASFTFYVLVGLLISLLLFLSSIYFTHFFKVDPIDIPIIKNLFIVASLTSLVIWPMSTFRGAIQGLNMWKTDAAVNISNQALLAVATYFMLTNGYGIIQLFVVTQLLTLLGNLVLYYVVRAQIGLKIVFPFTEPATFKHIFNFSFFIFLSSLIAAFLYQAHNIIIGYLISMSAISVYAVAYNLQNYFRVINSTIGAPAWLVASQMEGAHDYANQKRLLFKGTKFMSAVMVPMIIIVFIFAEPFINFWMGPSFHESIIAARIIIIFWLFNGTCDIAFGMLSVKSIVRRPVLIILVAAIVNLLICAYFIRSLGISAVALGLAVSSILISFPLTLRLSLKTLKVTFAEYFNKSIKDNLKFYFLVCILSLFEMLFFYPTNLIFTVFEMGLTYLISLVIYYFVFLNYSERKEIRGVVGLGKLSGLFNGLR